jgi:hypothetical protein
MAYSEGGTWSFFTLNGCPLEFVMAMARFSNLASIYEKTTRMEWTIFDDSPVIAEVMKVTAFVNTEDVLPSELDSLNSSDDIHARRNKFHCVEAWRHAILLYVCRVFSQTKEMRISQKPAHLARLVLDSVRCIPATDFIQKQVLLPMFLAGAELRSGQDREFARKYCKHWSDTSRAYHFESAAEMLEDIWRESDTLSECNYWWGYRVNSQTDRAARKAGVSFVSEVLLG